MIDLMGLFGRIKDNPLDLILTLLRVIGIFALASVATFAIFYAAVFIIPTIFNAIVGAVGGFVPNFFSGYIFSALSAGYHGMMSGLASGFWFSKLISGHLLHAAVNTSLIAGAITSVWYFFQYPGIFANDPIIIQPPAAVPANPLANMPAPAPAPAPQPGQQAGNGQAPAAQNNAGNPVAPAAPQQGIPIANPPAPAAPAAGQGVNWQNMMQQQGGAPAAVPPPGQPAAPGWGPQAIPAPIAVNNAWGQPPAQPPANQNPWGQAPPVYQQPQANAAWPQQQQAFFGQPANQNAWGQQGVPAQNIYPQFQAPPAGAANPQSGQLYHAPPPAIYGGV